MEFLNIVATDIIRRIDSGQYGQMKDLTIVFPNKRASLFFNQYLAQHAQPPIWAPRYTTISEMFLSMSRLTVADPALLIFYLYKAYLAETGEDESFDHFYSWGEVLLSDFDDIDSAMVDAQKLFINISDLEQLTRFDYIDHEQEEAIRKLFESFNIKSVTQLQERYLRMWKAMPRIYRRFRQMLTEQGYAYPGMMKRDVIEHLDITASRLDGGTYAVVGFNVLNETERQLFLHLRRTHQALFYWDYDEAFTSNPDMEAGMFISDNIKLFGNSLANHPELFRNLKDGKKNIRFVASSTDSAQCSYAGAWLADTLGTTQPLNKTAVVLCDESLLPSVLNTIPPTYDGHHATQLNITMGYPLGQTPVVGFIMAVLELIYRGWRGATKHSGAKWRYTYAERVLRHPYTLLMAKDDATRIIIQCKQQNLTYPDASLFDTGTFISRIFQPPHADMVADLEHLGTLLQTIAMHTDDVLYTESIYTAYTTINRFCRLMRDDGLHFATPDTLLRLMRQALSARSVAFHGEPAVGVQLMGILETRNLDFDNIIMLSTNEGMLPRQSHSTSFILNFLREANGMTTTRRRIALYAYYFYRLISRATNITLVYNNSTDGLHRGEMSRFMMQLKYEGGAMTGSEIIATSRQDEGKRTAATLVAHTTAHTEPITSLSPSAINTYLDCKLRFYLQHICHFSEDDEVSEDVADNTFGSIFHNAMERFYATRLGRPLNPHDFHISTGGFGRDHDTAYTIRRLVDQAFAKELFNKTEEDIAADRYTLDLSGTQLLNHEVICRYVYKQLMADMQLTPLTILATERKLYHQFAYTDIHGRRASVNIGGIIDREDICTVDGNQLHRIVDYKTSVRAKTAGSIADLFDRTLPSRSSHIFQTFYYCEVMLAHLADPTTPLSPALLYIKQAQDPRQAAVKIGGEPITDYRLQCHDEFASRLSTLLAEMLDPSNSFEANTDDSHCTFCPFKSLCK